MGNILTADVMITSTRPLWWHRFGPDAIPLEKKERTGVAGNDPEEWRRTVLVTKDGQLFLEPTYAFAAIRDAGRYTKRGHGSLVQPIAATLQVVDARIPTDRYFPGFPNGHVFDVKTADPPDTDDEARVYLDIRGVRNPSTKARNVRYRIAASPGWVAAFSLLWDKTVVSRNELESVMHDAGKLIGVGNGRNVGMGRGRVGKFDVREDWPRDAKT